MLFKILLIGEHTNHDYGDSYGIDPLTSSVTLLSDGTSNVLFDSGSLSHRNQMLAALAETGLNPADITHVMLTHDHLDHTSNCVLFENAEIHVSRALVDHKTGASKIYVDHFAKPLPLGIELLLTPGHTPEHCSYIFEVDGDRYCVAGDAVREDTLMNGGAPHFYEDGRATDFIKSARKVFDSCDKIIPGHFKVIEGDFKDELYQNLCTS